MNRAPAMAGGRRTEGLAASLQTYRRVYCSALAFARGHDYAGHNKHDGLNSPLLNVLFGGTRSTRILAIQLVMRAPWNLRPLLHVPRTRNPKGLALFADALLDLYAADRRRRDLVEAETLLDWLLEHPARGFEGLSWGYPYPWQDLGFFVPRHYPNRVVSCWIGLALAAAVRLTGSSRYREALVPVARFLTREPRVLCDDSDMKCYSYVPDPAVTQAVMDVPALVGAYLAEAAELLERADYRDEARRLLNWVADKQTPYGGWFYTHPAHDSFISHDNYHTAIILDCFDRYRAATGDLSFDEVYWHGLHYYRDQLFTASGAPRWRNDREYPYDVHGAASGILCFVRAAARDPHYAESAKLVADWTIENLYDPRGYFYYQKTRWLTKRFCLLRWCNGWMCRALGSIIRYCSSSPAGAGYRPPSSG